MVVDILDIAHIVQALVEIRITYVMWISSFSIDLLGCKCVFLILLGRLMMVDEETSFLNQSVYGSDSWSI